MAWAAAALLAAAPAPTVPQPTLPTIALTLETGSGPRRYRVELADTRARQSIGMMGRMSIGRGRGMLFPRNPASRATFWMRDTPLPLDMVFIAEGGRVESIAARVAPLSDAVTSSRGPVVAVLELAGGEAERIGLKPGDRANYRLPAPR